MKYLSRLMQVFFAAALFLVGTGCSGTSSNPLSASATNSSAAREETQEESFTVNSQLQKLVVSSPARSPAGHLATRAMALRSSLNPRERMMFDAGLLNPEFKSYTIQLDSRKFSVRD